MNSPKDTVLKVVQLLYGTPKSDLHWYLTYLDNHTERLKMTLTKTDPCLLIKHNAGKLAGIVIQKVDDSLGIGTAGFMKNNKAHQNSSRKKKGKYLLNHQ